MKRLCRACLLAVFGASTSVLSITEAAAQCSARDVMRSHPSFSDFSSPVSPPAVVQSAIGTPVWKTIHIGAAEGKWALYRALAVADCGMGDAAEQMFIAPEFAVSAGGSMLDLVVVSVAELGFGSETAQLKDIYAQAQKIGFALPAADVGPQLRLQYFDQPVGEFLNVAMKPIKIANGEPDIFMVGNGGAGLLLVGEAAGPNAEFHASSRFVFVRPIDIARARR